MGRRRMSGRVEYEGLVCWVDEDQLAELSLVTDDGRELLIEPGGPIDDSGSWVDAYVHVRGRFTRRDDQRYLRVERVVRLEDEWRDRPPVGDPDDWPVDEYRWDDNEEEYEDYH